MSLCQATIIEGNGQTNSCDIPVIGWGLHKVGEPDTRVFAACRTHAHTLHRSTAELLAELIQWTEDLNVGAAEALDCYDPIRNWARNKELTP